MAWFYEKAKNKCSQNVGDFIRVGQDFKTRFKDGGENGNQGSDKTKQK